MAGLERGDDALGAAARVKGRQGFVIIDGHVLRTAGILEPGMLWPHARVVQARRDRMRLLNLAIGILEQIGAVAMQHARRAGRERGRMVAGVHSMATSLDPNQGHVGLIDVVVENAHGIAATAHTGHHHVGLPAHHLGHLPEAFLAHHRIEIAHHHWVGVRARHGANNVEGVFDICDPVAHGLIQRIF